MKRLKLSPWYWLILIIPLLLSACEQQNPNSPQLTPITLKLSWIPDAHQLGFWVALDKGFYEARGLKLTILPGGLDANPIRDVVSGAADIGQVGGIEQVITAQSEGLPIKAIASIHRKTPHALISLASNPIRNAQDLQGKTVAVAFGDTAEILLKAFMAKQGIGESAVKFAPFRFDLTPLISGQVDAVTGFSTGQPITLTENALNPVVMEYSSAGVESYGYSLVTSDKTLLQKRANLKEFLAATREGWSYAFNNVDEAVEIFVERFDDSVSAERTKNELALIRDLMLDGNGTLDTWQIDAERVRKVTVLLTNYGDLKSELEPNSTFDNSLLE